MRDKACTSTLNYAAVHEALWDGPLGPVRTTGTRKTSPAAQPSPIQTIMQYLMLVGEITTDNVNERCLSSNHPHFTTAPAFPLNPFRRRIILVPAYRSFFTANSTAASWTCLAELLPHTDCPPLAASRGNEETQTPAARTRRISNYILFKHASGHRG